MAYAIPFEANEPRYQFRTVLSGSTYTFDVHWNERDGAWYFDLLTEDEVMIIAGVKIVLGMAIGRRSADPAYPIGLFRVVDTSGQNLDATFYDLGTRVQVLWLTEEDLEAV